jgi:hypothetical protein
MRVVDAEGRFVGFVKEIAGQNLVIGRPSASEIQIPIVDCEMTTDKVRLSLTAQEVAQMGRMEPGDREPRKYRT